MLKTIILLSILTSFLFANIPLLNNTPYAQVLQEITDDKVVVSYTYGNDLISQTRDDKTTIYHYDGLGSARYLSDENGEFTDSYDYEAFGKLLNKEGNTTNNYLYTGEQFDSETDNYYLRARYYSPQMMRFTQMDSYMGNSQDPISLHKYLYANANPVLYTDPTGHFSMMETSLALDVKNTLANVQFESYNTLLNVVSGGGWDGSLEDIPEMAGTALGLRLLLRFNNSPQIRAVRKVCRNSFDGQTLVATEKGLVPIEEIKIGDRVWAYDENNGTKSLQTVTHLIRGENYKELIDIKLETGEIITTTDNHPFWEVNVEDWIKADTLTTNSILFDISESNVSIYDLNSYHKDGIVYNLTVSNYHNYFVGQTGVLGHNCEPFEEELLARLALENVSVSEAKRLLGRWDKSTFERLSSNLEYHVNKHGKGQGMAKYLRKADSFNFKGAREIRLSNGRTKFQKKGGTEFIITNGGKNGKIITYGSNEFPSFSWKDF